MHHVQKFFGLVLKPFVSVDRDFLKGTQQFSARKSARLPCLFRFQFSFLSLILPRFRLGFLLPRLYAAQRLFNFT